jgi:hypothetical protein
LENVNSLGGLMPPRIYKAPTAAFAAPTKLAPISKEQWQRIEETWGLTIGPKTRSRIREATLNMIEIAQMERDAAPWPDTRRVLRRITAANRKLLESVSADSDSPGAEWARNRLVNLMKDPRLGWLGSPPGNDPLRELKNVLLSFEKACAAALQMEKDDRISIVVGDAREIWTQRLFKILIGTGKKRRGDIARLSATMRVIEELLVPHDLSPTIQSPQAHTKAVTRALRSLVSN